MAKQTLAEQLKLVDPVWGGVDQYSTDGDWDHPHFEKIIQFQAENMRTYANAYAQWKESQYLQTAEGIHRFVRDFLTSPKGSFYTSQDADVVPGQHAGEYYKLNDAQRRKIGLPKVDTHIYARENGWMIYALTQLYAATGNENYLKEAITAAKNMLQVRSLPSGGFRHDATNQAGPYLGDALYMGRALLALYAVTGDRDWLDRAGSAADFMIDRCQLNAAGVLTTAASGANLADPKPEYDENVAVARFANLLARYEDNNANYRKLAECAMRYLATPEIARKRRAYARRPVACRYGGELRVPLHIVIVGGKNDPGHQKNYSMPPRGIPSFTSRSNGMTKKIPLCTKA